MKNTPNIINTRDMSASDRPLAPVVDGNRPAAGNGKTTYKTATAAANAAKTYAAEAAQACREYAFCTLGFDEVYSIIRDNNLPSQKVAERNGMKPCGRIIKHYYGIDMPHIVYSVRSDGQTK